MPIFVAASKRHIGSLTLYPDSASRCPNPIMPPAKGGPLVSG